MKKRVFSILLALATLFLFSCSDKVELREKSIYAMDTVITVNLYCDGETMETAYKRITKLINNIETTVSRTSESSEIYALNSGGETLYYPDETTVELITASLDIANKTGGAYNPAIASLTDIWQINSLEAVGIPAEAAINEAMSHIDYSGITVEEDKIVKADAELKIDLGGIGKGYAAQKVIDYLNSTAICYGLLSFGGNVAVFGNKPDGSDFKIGVRNPTGDGTVGNVSMRSGFVSVSGSYERYREVDGVKYHHIFDPETGYPTDNGLVSVVVVSKNGTEADALSTALFVLGLEKGYEFYESGKYEFEAIFITDGGEIYLTDGIKGDFELTSADYTIAEFENA